MKDPSILNIFIQNAYKQYDPNYRTYLTNLIIL